MNRQDNNNRDNGASAFRDSDLQDIQGDGVEFYDPAQEQKKREERRRKKQALLKKRDEELRDLHRKLAVAGSIAAVAAVIAAGAAFAVTHGKNGHGSTEAAEAVTETAAAETAAQAQEAAATEASTEESAQSGAIVFKETSDTAQIPTAPANEERQKQMAQQAAFSASSGTSQTQSTEAEQSASQEESAEAATEESGTGTSDDGNKVVGGDYVDSLSAIMVNADDGTIVAERNPKEKIVPASMTKVMTILTACEHLTKDDMDKTYTITQDITDKAYINDASNVGYMPGDAATVRDMLYGTILESGADAAMGLAEYVAGSQDAFVQMMNDKLDELGISDSAHFTNCIGLYDENHYCTVYDMAVIMKAAMDNECAREVLGTHTWTTQPMTEYPEGRTISNWFLRRIEDRDTKGTVVGAKTGFVTQSGNCAVSYEKADNGTNYIVCTANAQGNWRCIRDHVALYEQYVR